MDPEKDINFKKIVFGTLFLIVLGVIIIWAQRSSSQIILTAHNNKFNLSFNLGQNEKANAQKTLEKLGLSQNVLEGIQFELDATSQARLAFVTPVTFDLEFTKERLNFQGKATGVLSGATHVPIANLQIPASTSLAILAPDFGNLIKKRLAPMPADLQAWLDQNLASTNGQYLIIFGDGGDFALVVKPLKQPDFTALATLQSSTSEPYKQETTANLNFHLVKLPQESQKEITFTFFEQGLFLFMASSRAAAQELANVQKGDIASLNFWPNVEKPVSAAIFWQNSQEVNQDSLSFLVGEDTHLAATLAKISQARLIIRDQEFSGYLDFSDEK